MEQEESIERNSAFTLKIPTTDWALYKAVSDRFGTTLGALINDLLDGAAKEIFFALDESERAEIAKKADAYQHEAQLKNGQSTKVYYGTTLDKYFEKGELLKEKDENGHEFAIGTHHWLMLHDINTPEGVERIKKLEEMDK